MAAALPGRVTNAARGPRWLASGVASFLRQLSLFDPPAAAELSQAPAAPREHSIPHANPVGLTSSAGHACHDLPVPRTATSDDRGFAPLLRGPYARIEVAVRPRLHESWRVTWVRKREALRLEIPALLAEAPEVTKAALLEWALLVSVRPRRGHSDTALRARRMDLEKSIRAHLEGPAAGSSTPAAARRSARDARKLARLRPQGEYHDLDAILRAVNERYFEGTLEARITWAARLGGLSTHTMATDGEGKRYHLLTISRGYDVPEATTEIVGGVVYHECLHIAIPPRREADRRVVHGPDFRKREREYAHFVLWRKWHREGLPVALRRLQRRARKG